MKDIVGIGYDRTVKSLSVDFSKLYDRELNKTVI
jgi:hypothetical protein